MTHFDHLIWRLFFKSFLRIHLVYIGFRQDRLLQGSVKLNSNQTWNLLCICFDPRKKKIRQEYQRLRNQILERLRKGSVVTMYIAYLERVRLSGAKVKPKALLQFDRYYQIKRNDIEKTQSRLLELVTY